MNILSKIVGGLKGLWGGKKKEGVIPGKAEPTADLDFGAFADQVYRAYERAATIPAPEASVDAPADLRIELTSPVEGGEGMQQFEEARTGLDLAVEPEVTRLAPLDPEDRLAPEMPQIARSVYVANDPVASISSVYDQSSLLDYYELDDPGKVAGAWGSGPKLDAKKLDRWKEISKSVCLVTFRMESAPAEKLPCGVWKNGALKQNPMFGQAVTKDGVKSVEVKPSFTKGLKPVAGDALETKFATQQTTGFGTGFLVAPNQIVTAGHVCPNDKWISSLAFVFDYKIGKDGKQPGKVPTDQIFYAVKLARPAKSDQQYLGDCSVITLDRPVPKTLACPLVLGSGAVGKRVGAWGHPCGLPMKSVLAGKSMLKEILLSGSLKAGYLANIDTFGGNSGSPIFNLDDEMKVIGMLIEGGTDFQAVGPDAFTYAKYSSDQPKEKILKQEHFKDLIA